MVYATANLHRLFFEHTHARCRFTRVQHTGLRSLQLFHVFTRHGSNTAHPLHHVQHQAFRLQQRLHSAFHYHSDITRFYFRAIFYHNGYLHFGVETVKNFFRNFHSGKHSLLFDKQFRFAHGIRRNTRQGGMVAIPYILGKSEVYQSVN